MKKSSEKIFTEQLTGKGYTVKNQGKILVVSKGKTSTVVHKTTISPIRKILKK